MTETTKKCPYCFEEIKFEAKKCKWCRSNLAPVFTSGTWSRDLPGRRFLGVANVLALNTGIPVLAWRVIFVVTTLIHGIGLVAYLAVWALTPFRFKGRSPVERISRASKLAYETIRKDPAESKGSSEVL